MSGGYFDHKQHWIDQIAESVEDLIKTNDSEELDTLGDKIGRGYEPDIIEHFKEGVRYLRKAAIYAQRIDWLVSDDDGPDSFRERLAEELKELEEEQ